MHCFLDLASFLFVNHHSPLCRPEPQRICAVCLEDYFLTPVYATNAGAHSERNLRQEYAKIGEFIIIFYYLFIMCISYSTIVLHLYVVTRDHKNNS